MKCIYCLKEAPEISFNKVEHVIPASFGAFKNNFTLRHTVCDDCNQYFGNNLEIYFARGTREGISRFEFNIKPADKFKTSGKKSRLIMKRSEEPFKGAYAELKYSPQEDKILSLLLPQVGFLKNLTTKEYEFFLLDEIPSKDTLDKKGFCLNNPEGIIFPGDDVTNIKNLLKQKGITLHYGGLVDAPDKPEGKVPHEVEYTIDDTVLRTVSKITFNYLAFWQGADFVFHHDFNTIRKYIRYGQKPDYPLVLPSNDPILGDEPIEGKRRVGHIVTVNWALDGISIISQVALFNDIKYKVSLARNFSGEQINIKKGLLVVKY